MARSRDRDKPSHIIDAAFAVFGENGYTATRIRHIADLAGISSGTIYTYFRDKKDLFRATVQEGWNRFLAQIRTLASSEEPTEARLESLIEIGFQTLKKSLPLLRGMLFESSQMNLLQGSLEELCALIEEILSARARRQESAPGARRPESAPGARRQESAPGARRMDAVYRRDLIRVTVVGLLFSAALVKPSRVDAEIESLRGTIKRMLKGG
jgi:AcrR family transcriptional regulator